MKPVILTAIEGNPVKLTTSEAPMGSPGAPLDPERIPPDRGPGPPDGPSPLPRPGSPGSPIEASNPPGSYGGRRCPCHRRALRRPNSGALSRRDCPGPSDPACRKADRESPAEAPGDRRGGLQPGLGKNGSSQGRLAAPPRAVQGSKPFSNGLAPRSPATRARISSKAANPAESQGKAADWRCIHAHFPVKNQIIPRAVLVRASPLAAGAARPAGPDRGLPPPAGASPRPWPRKPHPR